MLIIPTKNNEIKEAKKLNDFSKLFRTLNTYDNVSEDGFEMGIGMGGTAVWEWVIKFKDSSGFMVLVERPTTITYFIYRHKDDLDPLWGGVEYGKNQFKKLNQIIRNGYLKHIK